VHDEVRMHDGTREHVDVGWADWRLIGYLFTMAYDGFARKRGLKELKKLNFTIALMAV